jgi:fucose permease
MALGRWKLLPIHISQVSHITNTCAGSTNIVPVCGPPRYAELRINLSQAFNGIGTVVAPVLGSYVFFLKTQDDVQALKNVQWVYLAIAIFVFVLAVVFYL